MTARGVSAAKVVVAILNSTHHNTEDFSVTIPAELLAQQQRSQIIFTYVMVAIAARKPTTLAQLQQVSGVGPKLVEAYGRAVLALLR